MKNSVTRLFNFQVEIFSCGPFDSKYVVVLRDTYSNFVVARIIDDGAKNVASAVFSSLCEFGLASCVLVEKNRELFHSFLSAISDLWSSLDGVALRPEPVFSRAEELSSPAKVLDQKIRDLAEMPDWTDKFDGWLFKLRTSIQVESDLSITLFSFTLELLKVQGVDLKKGSPSHSLENVLHH